MMGDAQGRLRKTMYEIPLVNCLRYVRTFSRLTLHASLDPLRVGDLARYESQLHHLGKVMENFHFIRPEPLAWSCVRGTV